jgi:hypothetical protein
LANVYIIRDERRSISADLWENAVGCWRETYINVAKILLYCNTVKRLLLDNTVWTVVRSRLVANASTANLNA